MPLSAITAAGVGFGIAGMGALGALLVIPLIMNGVRSRVIVIFALMSILAAVVAGVILGESVARLWPAIGRLLDISAHTRLALHVVGFFMMVGAFIYVFRQRNAPKKDRKTPTILTGTAGMAFLGVIWGLISLADPSFYGLAAVMHREGILATAYAFTLWIVISQSPLFVVVIAMLIGRDSPAMQRAISFAKHLDRVGVYLMLAIIAAVAAYFAVSSLTFLHMGRFLPI